MNVLGEIMRVLGDDYVALLLFEDELDCCWAGKYTG